MSALDAFLIRMGLKPCETDPQSAAVVALANTEAEWLEELYGAIGTALGERGQA